MINWNTVHAQALERRIHELEIAAGQSEKEKQVEYQDQAQSEGSAGSGQGSTRGGKPFVRAHP